MNDLKGDLQAMYMRAGVKDEGVLFLFTDGQITNEKFLVFINDLLASGRPRGDRPRATGPRARMDDRPFLRPSFRGLELPVSRPTASPVDMFESHEI